MFIKRQNSLKFLYAVKKETIFFLFDKQLFWSSAIPVIFIKSLVLKMGVFQYSFTRKDKIEEDKKIERKNVTSKCNILQYKVDQNKVFFSV